MESPGTVSQTLTVRICSFQDISQVKRAYEWFISQPLTMGDFALACTEAEMRYWTRRIHGLRDRLNIVINKWELTKLGVELAGEAIEHGAMKNNVILIHAVSFIR